MNSTQKITNDTDIDKAFSRFKLWVSFKDKKNKTFYAKEKDSSYRQIVFGKVKNVTFDHEKGFNSLIYLSEKLYLGKYNTAIIYDRLYPNVEVRKYVDGKVVKPYIEMEFTSQTRSTYYIIQTIDGIQTLLAYPKYTP